MEQLKRVFEDLGFGAVTTFIASGNVVFESAAGTLPALEKQIERELRTALGYDVATFLRSGAELRAIVDHEPFRTADWEAEGHTLFVVFLREPPAAGARRRVLDLRNDRDDLAVSERDLLALSRVHARRHHLRGATGEGGR
jgi:uncharacterized protein (DUF1697 family)